MDKLNLINFDWGWMNEPTNMVHIFPDGTTQHMGQYHKESIIGEIFDRNCYTQFFDVEDGDIVLDIGASVGPFTFSILHKKPKQVYCFEPSEREFKTLCKNVNGYPVIPIPKGISNVNSTIESNELFGGESEMETITFERFIKLYNVDRIDFIKTDCEGGEYDIFTLENLEYLKHNVKKVVGEWHLRDSHLKSKFRHFRDNFLHHFKHIEVYSVDGANIKWDLWNEHFIEYYTEVIIHIDNR
jgi:FkbM family methyltransferase